MTQIKKRWLANHMSTIMGILVAVSTAWLTIDWTTFDITKEWPKLILSAIIAVGGYVTTIKIK